jgi:predicted DNA-binding transcriptional regulator YafY
LKEYLQSRKSEESKNLELIVISLPKSKGYWLDHQKYYYGFVSQRPIDEQLEMTFLCSSPENFARWFMMFGGSATIIESEILKNHVRQMIGAISKSL